MFARIDLDGDGLLSRAELVTRLRQDEELAKMLQLPQAVGQVSFDGVLYCFVLFLACFYAV